MAGRKSDFVLPTLDDLFSTQEMRDEQKLARIRDIPIELIDSFPDHPFKVRDDEDMTQLVESIKERGVITPATVRPKDDGRYELVSGHRRKRACELAGMDTLRCEVVELTRDEATILMVESNFQRSQILPSEKAFAYKMRLDAMNRQFQSSSNSTPQLGQTCFPRPCSCCFDFLAQAIHNVGFIDNCIAFVSFILQDRAYRGAVPFSLPARGGNVHIIQHFHDSSHAVPGQEPLINQLDGLSFFGVDFRLAIFTPAVAEEVLVVEGNLALFRTLILAPYDVGADILRFALSDGTVNRDIKLCPRLCAVDVLLLEEDVHTNLLQHSHIF